MKSEATKKKGFWNSKIEGALLVVCLLIFSFIALYNLGYSPLENWDEAFYAENIKQIVQKNEWVVMYFNGESFLEKPPLYMWIAAVLVKIIGLSEFAVRLPSAIAGILCVGLVTWYAYKRFSFVPAVAAFFTIALNTLFVWRTRNGDLDTLATFFFILIFFLIVSKHKYRYPLLGLSFFLLYITKLALVALPVLIFCIYELVYNRSKLKSLVPEYIQLALAAIIPAGIWVGAAYLHVGQEVFKAFILRADAGVFEPSLQHFSFLYPTFAFYSFHKLFVPFVVWGLACVIVGLRKQWNFTVFLFSTVLMLQLMFFERKNNWYLLPMFPFWAFAVAYGVQKIHDIVKKEAKKRKLPQWTSLLVNSCMVLLLIVIGVRTYQVNIVPTFTSYGTTREMQTALFAKQLTAETEPIVRLDHSYPTTIYYSDRKVLSSPIDYTGDGGFVGRDHFISRENVVKAIQEKRVRVVLGKKTDLQSFVTLYSLKPVKITATNDEEAVAQF